ncbi:hypothetical protein V2W45_834431 [Cenococcum geophilum]
MGEMLSSTGIQLPNSTSRQRQKEIKGRRHTLLSGTSTIYSFLISNQSEPQFSDQELASSHSGLSQRFEDHSLANKGVIPDSQPSVQQITPDTTIQSK